jgi:Atypical PilZ domain, cyclic di-GMP receptor
MPESFLGDGLIFEELLPLSWDSGAHPEGLSLARMNSDNQQLLGAEASLDEVRVHESLKDESPALLHELQRLEFKLNVLLRLTADLAVRSSSLPPAQPARLFSRGLEWTGERAPLRGETGILSAYINPALPQPLRIPCTVVGERIDAGLRVAQLRFSGLSDTVVDLLEKLIFRHHRRLVAGARLASATPAQ